MSDTPPLVSGFVTIAGRRVELNLGDVRAADLDGAIAVAACRRPAGPAHRLLAWEILLWQRHAWGSLAAAREALSDRRPRLVREGGAA